MIYCPHCKKGFDEKVYLTFKAEGRQAVLNCPICKKLMYKHKLSRENCDKMWKCKNFLYQFPNNSNLLGEFIMDNEGTISLITGFDQERTVLKVLPIGNLPEKFLEKPSDPLPKSDLVKRLLA